MSIQNEQIVPAASNQQETETVVAWWRKAFGWLTYIPEWRLVIALLIACIILAFLSPAFLSGNNIRSVSLAFSFTAIAALGQLLVILTGGIDLSVGSLVGLAGMVCAYVIREGGNPVMGVTAALLVTGIAGLANGLFIVRFKIHPFIITLGMLQIARGITVGITQGNTITGFPQWFLDVGNETIAGVPIPVWIMLALGVVFGIFLTYSRLGRELYAIGGNPTAARLAGVPMSRNLLIAYVISGVMAGVAGSLLVARLGSAVSNAGVGMELNVIAAVVIGGASLSGGKGTAFGVLLGALLIGLVNNALVLLFVPTYWQQTFIGAVIVLAALADRLRRR